MYIPKYEENRQKARNMLVDKLSGMCDADIANKYKVTTRHVLRLIKWAKKDRETAS